jgi:Zn-dependent metalloprotease
MQVEIVRRGNAAQRDAMLQTLTLSEGLRGQRLVRRGLVAGIPAGEKRRTVYDARHSTVLPGRLVRGEGAKAARDKAVNEAYDGSGAMYDFLRQVYGRNSIDDQGMRLDATVHYGVDYDNAFWNGSQMVYGDGDGRLFGRFTAAIDVIGHELMHGLIDCEAGLVYRDQPGALNESLSDVFGSLLKQWLRGETADTASWIVGEGLFTPQVRGKGIRSLAAPGTAYDDPVLGKDPQPDHMRACYTGADDSGGVHINSGIPNRAFYLTARALGGAAWEKAGRIWYLALRDRLRPTSSFADAAALTSAVAGELFGKAGAEQQAVIKAWRMVGVKAA